MGLITGLVSGIASPMIKAAGAAKAAEAGAKMNSLLRDATLDPLANPFIQEEIATQPDNFTKG